MAHLETRPNDAFKLHNRHSFWNAELHLDFLAYLIKSYALIFSDLFCGHFIPKINHATSVSDVKTKRLITDF